MGISGDTVVVGAWGESSSATGVDGDQNDNSALNAGAAYVFVRNAGIWSQQAYLKASNTEMGDLFGGSVAVSGDTVVVGANQESSGATGVNGNEVNNSAASAGAGYVFVRNGTTWTQQAYLKASNTGANDLFGQSVAVSGDTVVVGAYQESNSATGVNGDQSDNGATNSGAAYVFVRNGTSWSQQSYLKASNTGQGDGFGFAVTVSSNTVVVGAYGEDSNAAGVNGDQNDNSAPDSGAAYAFVRTGTTWTQQSYLKASTARNSIANFGTSVAVSGDTMVVGASALFNHGQGSAVYVFVRSGTNWSQQAQLTRFRAMGDDGFGLSVAASGDTVVVGAPFESRSATGVNGDQTDTSFLTAGAAYVFVRTGTHWRQEAYLKASNTDAGDYFGSSVAISGDTVVVGANRESSSATGVNGDGSNNSAIDSGAAYVFVRNGTNWSQQAYLKASNAEGAGLYYGDLFGSSVAVSGDTIVVGALLEASNATGVNGDQNDNSMLYAGAAYVFVRTGETWSQQAYLKASNTGHDLFGRSVAVSGDTVVVGADEEFSSATGVNGDQSDNTVPGAGAAYVFVRTATNWAQQAYLKASNTGTNDLFGFSVAISGDRVVVGAIGEGSSATGVNGNQNDNSAATSGAAYVFVRTGTNWSQQAYLKASNTGSNDSFGQSVAVSGDTVVVGAYQEDSNATGVNGDQSDNSATDSGAAYVFTGFGNVSIASRLTLARDDSIGYLIRFTGAPDLTYHLQRAVLATGPWNPLGTLVAPASGTLEYHDAAPPSGQAFYRVVQP